MYKLSAYSLQRHDPNTYSDKRVLIVEDVQSMARTLASVFQELNFKDVYIVKDGREAIDRLATHSVDLILSDWNMPRMNGLDLLIYIRNHDLYAAMPFIMISGNIDPVDVTMAIKAGVSEYIVKPYTKKILKEKIHRAITLPPSKNQLPEAERLASQEQKKHPKNKQRTILIVDDVPDNLLLLAGLLKNEYKVIAARTGGSALKICSKDIQPDLILLDIMMPEIDGLEVCRRLKADSKTEHIPIIFVSALSQHNDTVKGLTLGAVDYLTKPIIPQVLNARVKNHIKIIEQREEVVAQVDSLIENLRMRDEMDRMLQHEIRNPLTAIISATEKLQEQASQFRGEVEIIKNSSQVMNALLNNKMMLPELESKSYKLALEVIDVASIVEEICIVVSAKNSEKNIKFRRQLSAAQQFKGDKLLIYIIFYNLVNNAVEATPVNGLVSLSCSLSADNNELTFLIHNPGVIPEEIQNRFFDKFISIGKAKGSGIGTYSAYLATQALNGDITFTTSKEKGTTLKLFFKKIE